MKVNKIFSLDMDIVEKLKKEENASYLVNEVLKIHFNTAKLSLPELKLKREQLKIIREAREKADSLKTEDFNNANA